MKLFNKPKIKFHTNETILDIIPHPIPARKAMPKWFKSLKPRIEGNDEVSPGTVKTCMPVLDALSEGYIIPLWADLHIKITRLYAFKDSDGKIIHYEGTDNPESFIGKETAVTKEIMSSFDQTDELSVFMKFPEIDMGLGKMIGSHGWQQVGNTCDLKKFKLGKVLLKFTNPWIIETSPGYSVYFKNPANDWSNEITLIEGLVDTDTYYNEVNFPYVWSGSEVGEWIIPQGTPLVHVIPIKRTDYNLEIGVINDKRRGNILKRMYSTHKDRYKRLFRSKDRK